MCVALLSPRMRVVAAAGADHKLRARAGQGRLLGAVDGLLVVGARADQDRHVVHRHCASLFVPPRSLSNPPRLTLSCAPLADLHRVGHLDRRPCDAAHRARPRGLRRRLVARLARHLCVGRRRRQRAHVRPALARALDDPVRGGPGAVIKQQQRRGRSRRKRRERDEPAAEHDAGAAAPARLLADEPDLRRRRARRQRRRADPRHAQPGRASL